LSKIYLKNEDAEESESDDDDEDEDDDDDSSSTDSERVIEYPEFNVVRDRVDKCEDKVKDALTKMDDVLTKLEQIDRKKRERREAMDELLRQISEFVKPGVEDPFPWFHDEDVTSSKLSTKSRNTASGMMQSTTSQPGPSTEGSTRSKDVLI